MLKRLQKNVNRGATCRTRLKRVINWTQTLQLLILCSCEV